MQSNAAAYLASDTGEIFSHDATSEIGEKIVETPLDAAPSSINAASGVTLISKCKDGCPADEKILDAGFLSDLDNLTKMQLRKKYRREEASHRNMLTRSRQRGNEMHPAFREFRNFLRLVGPIPASGATLDRIDNADPEYAPGKVRWADRRVQNNNKGDTLTFHDQQTGEVFTASRLAKLQGISASAVRKRLARGWSHAEIIAGCRGGPTSYHQPAPAPAKPETSCTAAPPPHSRPKSASETLFEREAEYFRRYREEHGEEALPAPHHDLNDGIPPELHVSEEEWLRKFAKDWPSYRPHVIFGNATPYHQRAIERVDPEYVKRERAKIATLDAWL